MSPFTFLFLHTDSEAEGKTLQSVEHQQESHHSDAVPMVSILRVVPPVLHVQVGGNCMTPTMINLNIGVRHNWSRN